MDEYKHIINKCSKCDISISCKFIPGKGEGIRNSVMFLLPHITKSEYNKGFGNGRNNKLLKEFIDDFNFNYYQTYLVKCPSKYEIRELEINNCISHFKDELFNVSPKIIVTVGSLVTSQFIKFDNFIQVVDKPKVLNINHKEVIIYPIYYDVSHNDVLTNYEKSFKNIALMYKTFIDNNYFNIKLLI